MPRAGRVARWLRVANHGSRSRKPGCRGTRLGPTQAVERIQLLSPGRRAVFYSITARRSTHAEEFKADMATLFQLLRAGVLHPVMIDRLPLAAASEVHARIDRGGLGGKIVLLPWSAT
jgi:NADPH:quinone reductase-like Zn-dependent oxidoreductase